ncbi:MAG: PEP-CTERM sorting domain-containing protein, partial [Planctomycetes bacterium]|nr:PEP-CTERM sorting domain-containing protein [Planctomycetota bacterium]
VLNADEPSASRGAAATGGFFPDPLFTWEAFPGELTDGRLNVVVPEPAPLAMVGLGMLFALRRGNGATRRGIRARGAGARSCETAWRERQRQ